MSSCFRFFTIVMLALTASCGSNAPGNPAAALPGDTTGVVVTPPPSSSSGSSNMTPPPAGANVTSVTPVADNFNTQDGLITASWGIPPSMGSDPQGAFRFICGAGQVSYDDPIVYPGQPGKSHLHQFYGNLDAAASSTYSSLRTNGDSTCSAPGAPVNRSGYWMPAMLDGAGHVVRPEYVAIYYKRLPASDPRCTRSNPGAEGDCVGIPTGLRFIAGYNMQSGTSDAHPFFYCQDSTDGKVKAVSSDLQKNITAVIPYCPVGARLTLNISGPDCWDGKNLDTPDHRSHMSFGQFGSWGYYRCPDDHPYVMPQLAIIAFYTVDENFEANRWHLSSDDMVPGAAPGTTFHADYWEAWSPSVRETWLANCINGHLNCAGGDLGNGTAIKGQTVPTANPRLVPVPTAPS